MPFKIWSSFLSEQDRVLYEQNVRLLLRNLPLFTLANFLGYIICTLVFVNAFSLGLHLIFGISMLLGSITIFVVIPNRETLFTEDRERGVRRLVLAYILVIAWWAVYFSTAMKYADVLRMQQFSALITMLSSIAVILVGRFTRLFTLCFCVAVAYIVYRYLNMHDESFRFLAVQILLTALAQLYFLRTLNEQIAIALYVKDENSGLVEALQNKNEALEQANYSQSRYLSAASHDLRQPLHALALLANDAQRKNTNLQLSETLQKMEQAIDSLSLSFNAMLNLSRLDAGVVKPQFTRFPIQRLFTRLMVEYADMAQQKNLSFKIHPSQAWVLSDEGMLYSILGNFVSNALRYTDKGGVLIGVRHDAGQALKIMVYDTGSGVPSEKAKQIFQEYQRLEAAEQRVKGGVGLGLAISERMARLLGARLLVKSIPEQGSCFGLMVPKVLAQEDVLADSAPIQDVLAGKRVAIIDDDEMALESLNELLSSWGMEVSIILSSDMLVESIAEEGDFDLVISDYHLGMAHETGLDILAEAQKIQKIPPRRLLMTGDTRTELAAEAQTLGVSVWYKPLRPVRFRAYLNTMLNRTGETIDI
ncbi:ATP-binding response regulator [Hydromonas duriensis]|uniref:histidine kinase n=1 Tax=Hydromonas duriensis TaxID=1527608 RepID=A0A4V3DJT7_9BURK|nr:hybrid sensor histidine kinase/response regulator [Hydromonas duriensis]TDR31405.1 signal transduction histidine kinase [Hydromonas duriensis]